jgi:hypothetical protein
MSTEYQDLDKQIDSLWAHPDGKRITVFRDDTYVCVGPNGRRKTTSATPEKLRAGYGRWERTDTDR